MVQLRKRKTPPPSTSNPPALKKAASKTSVKSNASTKSASTADAKSTVDTNGSTGSGKLQVGQTIELDGFGGEVETQEGTKVTLKGLVDGVKGDVVVFTYPKASTPGCTTQASLFGTAHPALTSPPHQLTIFGLSTDSPRANSTFKTKQNLPYDLLCDPSASLIGALGLKKSPKGTTRGVVVLSKAGEVKLWEAAGPAATVEAVQSLYPTDTTGGSSNDEGRVAEAVNHSDGLNTIESNLEKDIQAGKMNAQDAVDGTDQKMTDAPPPATLKETASEIAAQVADSAEIIDGDGAAAGQEEKKTDAHGAEKVAEVAAQVADSAEMVDGET